MKTATLLASAVLASPALVAAPSAAHAADYVATPLERHPWHAEVLSPAACGGIVNVDAGSADWEVYLAARKAAFAQQQVAPAGGRHSGSGTWA